jgi:hypothetical protein
MTDTLSKQLLNDPEFPATRGELTEWLCEKVEDLIGSANTGNGYTNDVLFQCLDYIHITTGAYDD